MRIRVLALALAATGLMTAGTSAADYAKANFAGTDLRQFPNIDNAYL